MTDTRSTTSSTTSHPPAAEDRQREAVLQALAESPVRSQGQVVLVDGRSLAYEVEAGFVPVQEQALGDSRGEPLAAVFTTAYQVRTEPGVPPRPVCFAFNGGPGSSSIFLHLGALGPMRVRIGDDGRMPPPPYRAEPNPRTWLAQFDLVFIDPPHTGYSLTATTAAREKMLSVDGDAEALSEVMRTWLTRHNRWGSPVYLCGESYGTTRACAMADRLAERGVALAGVVLVSCAMDLQTLEFHPRNDLAHALFLPAYAGVAQYHGLLKGPLAEDADKARAAAAEFVEQDYLRALHQGARLSGVPRQRLARRLAELTGLPVNVVEQNNLRISDQTFFFELLRGRSQMVGRLDARVTGPMAPAHLRSWEFDPGLEPLSGPYTMAAMDYFVGTLGFSRERDYRVSNGDAHKAWDWNRRGEKGNSYTCTSADLARAMRRLPWLKVLVASGLYDLGTPYSASEWTLDQMELLPTERARITHRTYGAGHMMYTREDDLQQLHADLQAWLNT